MIVRCDVGDYRKAKKSTTSERKSGDFDIGFSDQRVYVIDEHEWFDPHTSSHYDDGGISRHAMHGPSVIVTSVGGAGMTTREYHVNDPGVWAWVRRCIAEGLLTADNLAEGTVNNERDIHIN